MRKLFFAAIAAIALAACTSKTNDAPVATAEEDFEIYKAAVEALPDDADSLYIDLSKKFYEAHPSDSLGILVFNQILRYVLPYDEFKEAVEKACDAIKNDPHTQASLAAKLAEKETAPGTKYVDIEGTLVGKKEGARQDGSATSLSKIAGEGKLTLVDFWASWCGPCRREIPNIAEVAKKYDGKLNVVGIAVWDKVEETRKAMNELPIAWPIIFSERASEPYGIEGIPHIMLIGADGTILARDLRGEAIEQAVAEALK